jgi:hypothetical protein
MAGVGADVIESTMSVSEDTHQKAPRINLDPRWYGTVAEIGQGRKRRAGSFESAAQLER